MYCGKCVWLGRCLTFAPWLGDSNGNLQMNNRRKRSRRSAAPGKSAPEPAQRVVWRENLLIIVAALLVTGAVYVSAWVSDDAFLTLRYVWNTVNGYGPVFNVGEHVQGY